MQYSDEKKTKTILCFGDSNTWGFIPTDEMPDFSKIANNRYPWEKRWPGVLQSLLGDGYRVIENGLNGRTTFFDDPLAGFRNGADAVDICMLMNMPVDLLVIMLGCNDVKIQFHATPFLIAGGLEKIITNVKLGGYGPGGDDPEILVISPVSLLDNIEQTWLVNEFDAGSLKRDKGLAEAFKAVAERNGCHFMNAADYAEASPLDALHMDDAGLKKLAEAVYKKTKSILND